MAELKTKNTAQGVKAFIDAISDDACRKDCRAVMKIMREVTGEKPAMWGPSIVGYGKYHYKYASGREGDWFLTGLSPRKNSLTLYIMSGFARCNSLMKKLGKHKTGKACLYVKTLQEVDMAVLKELITRSVEYARKADKSSDSP